MEEEVVGAPESPAAEDADARFGLRVERLVALMRSEPLHRETYVRLLEFCKELRVLDEAEAKVQSCASFAGSPQSPYRLVRNLAELGGLEWVGLDEDGVEISEERKDGLTEDEVDDLVACLAVRTTEAGAEAAEKMSPARRLDDLAAQHPDRAGVFADVLSYCEEPRSLHDVEVLLERTGALDSLRAANGRCLRPSYFVDVLERAGGLEWTGAWRTTAAGEDLLVRLAG